MCRRGIGWTRKWARGSRRAETDAEPGAMNRSVRTLHGADTPLGTSLARHVKQWSRDNARVPMPWTAGPHGGFTTSLEHANAANTGYTPWQACSPDHVACNVADQDEDKESTLNFYRALVQFRKSYPVLVSRYRWTRVFGARPQSRTEIPL